MSDPNLIAAGLKPNSGDGANLGRLLEMRDLSIDNLGGLSVESFYSDLASEVGFETKRATDLIAGEEEILSFLEEQREAISGVNIDEEMVNLVQYQQAFPSIIAIHQHSERDDGSPDQPREITMGLRITSRILSSRSLTDIRNAQWGINDWRMQLSSGHRVNKPSDDPTAFLRILPLQNDILQSQQYQDNNVLARDVLNTAATALEDGVNIMSEARRIAVQGANGAMNSADRATLAASVEQLLGQMISIGNSKLGDRYLFAGTRTRTEPFVMTGNSFVNYQGDNENGNVTIAPGTDATISSSGQRIFMSSGRDATIFEGTTGVAAGSGTDSGDGIAMLQLEHTGFDALPSGLAAGSSSSSALGNLSITITTGPNAISINGGPSINFTGAETDLEIPTANGSSVFLDMTGFDNTPVAGFPTISEGRASWDGGASWTDLGDFTSSNLELRNATTGNILYIDTTGIWQTGSEQVNFNGTFDVFNSLIGLRDLLNNTQGLPSNEVAERLTALLGELDTVSENLLEGLRDVGARSAHLDLTESRMSSLELTLEEALSRDRDVDITEAVLELNQGEVAYQGALQVSARSMQMSLLNFLS
jgi:flagellar hook-associated protein 3 FlgL